MKTHRPFWYWLFREPSDFAALIAGLVFLWISAFAADHCISLFSIVWAELGGSGRSYYIAFPSSDNEFRVIVGAYGGFALMLIWRGVRRKTARFVVFDLAQVMVLPAIWAIEKSLSWYYRTRFPGSTGFNYTMLTSGDPAREYTETNTDLINGLMLLATLVTVFLLVQYLFVRLGWAIARPRFRFRASVFVRTWAYSNLAFGPLIFPFHLILGCLWLVFGGASPARSSLVLGLIWILAWTLYSTLVPITLAIRMVKRRAQYLRPGCLKCGYSLTGNVSGRCTECGTPIPKGIRKKLSIEPSSSQ